MGIHSVATVPGSNCILSAFIPNLKSLPIVQQCCQKYQKAEEAEEFDSEKHLSEGWCVSLQ